MSQVRLDCVSRVNRLAGGAHSTVDFRVDLRGQFIYFSATLRTIAPHSAGVSPLTNPDIADPRPAQGFLLDRVARGGGVLVVAGAVEIERVERAAVGSTISRARFSYTRPHRLSFRDD